MSSAEAFMKKYTREVEINGTKFLIRKINPADKILLEGNYPKRDPVLDENGFEMKDKHGTVKLIPYTRKQMSDIARKDQSIVLPRCILDPKIVEKPYGDQGDGEIPYELLDQVTSTMLLAKITEFSYELAEGVDITSFLKQQDGDESVRDSDTHEDSTEPDSE